MNVTANSIGIIFFCTFTASAAAQGDELNFGLLAQRCAPWVATETLAALVKKESDFNPFAIGINGGFRLARQPVSKDEAVKKAKWLVANGYKVDLGLGQVNIANLKRLGFSIEDAFDPCLNLSIGAGILQDSYLSARARLGDDQAALRAALSAYNTGSFSRGLKNGYVQDVVRIAVKSSTSIPRGVSRSVAASNKNEVDVSTSEDNVYNVVDRNLMVY